ncbi:ShKT domain-containing protein, partial [Meloidogyne graminicola]
NSENSNKQNKYSVLRIRAENETQLNFLMNEFLHNSAKIDGGIHAREWVSPAVVLFMIDQLVFGYETQPLIKQFVDQLDWFIVPLLNPDGYEYSRSSSDPEVRLWRKNRSPVQCTQISTGLFTPPNTQCCQGVDLNRNFDWFFGQVGSSSDPCSEIFSGNFAFSEPETKSVRDFISQQQGRIKTFMTFHSYSQILMYPFGHSLRTYPQDIGSKGFKKRIFWIDGGIHAREWASPHTALYFIYQKVVLVMILVQKFIKYLFNIYLNNFNKKGKYAFSEPESKAVRDALLSNRYRGRIDGFITLHTYSQIWIHPYGHKRDSYPNDVQDLFSLGQQATTAISQLYGTKYIVGSGADTLY